MQKIKFNFFLIVIFFLNILFAQIIEVSHPNPRYGIFSTYYLKVKPLNDGTRRVKLLEELIYIDPRGKRWTAPKGSVVDGASIPKVFQKVIGTPYGGEYTLASVIHDVACMEQKEPWEEVHQAFYDAMLASGVEKQKASIMYLAVYEGATRWGNNTNKHLRHTEVLDLLEVNNIGELVGSVRPFVEQLLFQEIKEKGLNALLQKLSQKLGEKSVRSK